uniref:Latent-transforming growth factor beta-binding protein 3 n=1 Tax=Tetraodon nigroviridis TaxID=99883 RepID=H3C340_TETNG
LSPCLSAVVCPLTCLNGGVCLSRKSCHCPPGFTGRLCQFPLTQTQQAQAARGNKQPVYPMSMKPDSLKLVGETSIGRTQMTQTHSVFTLPLSQGPHAPEVPFNVRVHHPPDTSVVIYPLDQSDIKLPHKSSPRIFFTRHKPKGRCFQETTPKQACNSTPLPVLTNQEDCCGSVGNSWGQNKCYQCPKLPNAPVKQTIVEDSGTTCPQGYKRFNDTHCQDINECIMQVVCQNGDCLNTLGSFKCSCKAGWVLEGNGCVVCPSEAPAEQGQCFLMASESRGCEHALPTYLTQDMCCCTVGKAWGPHCQPCPQIGTVAFSKICPAGKGYFYKERREIFAFPPIVYRKPDQDGSPRRRRLLSSRPRVPGVRLVKKALGGKLSPCVVNMQIIMLYSHQTLSNSSVSIGPTVVKTTPHQVTIIRLTPDNVPFETQTKVSDVDECKLNRNICGHGECESSLNGYVCHCHHGYHLNQIRNICEDNNECELEPCGHGRGHCVNTDGSFKCLCRQGYKHMVQQGRPKCIDLNECSKQDICGVRGQCINLPGSYKCECHGGFRIKSHRNPICEDVNECLNPDACPGELCENTVGSYECVPCLPGHEARGGTCFADINECLKPGMCPNGHCENLPGTYRCLCNEGFLPSSDSKGCSDINECEDFRLCANGRCINTEGSFQCQCYSGFQRTQEGSHCEDINECERPSNCLRGRCINSMGSYHCECQKGYVLVGGRRCQDVDECAADRNLCQPYGTCENRPGSYSCVCNHGYTLSENKRSCEAIRVFVEEKKECYLNLDDTVFCDSVLATNVTKQECCCSIGVGWGDHCEIYPCPVSQSAEFHSLCPNGLGLYYDEGLMYSLPAYHDIDECALFAEEICKRGHCENTLPGYECYCKKGFYYDSNLLECTDVNECEDPANCKNGRCVDTPGSYYCICAPPWTLATDRNSCVTPEEQADRTAAHKDVCFLHVDEGLICSQPKNDMVVTYSQCCCHYGRGWGPECNTCPPRHSGEQIKTFIESFWNSSPTPLVSDVFSPAGDSSEEDSDECSCANGRCVRSYLGTMCECNTGFRLDYSRTRCLDIDECTEPGAGASPCKNSQCVNTAGSYKCFCKHGFVPARRPNICVHRRTR